jgi:type II secretory pathway pseudopilin PulG
MNLGLMAESQRLSDSADQVIVVEPMIGSTSRTKGSLYLLVTGAGGRKLREATKTAAERIRDDYYYDLSAGISVCLRKAVRAANNVLLHSPNKPQGGNGESGPIGVALAVVRGSELYVATIGPAEAYLVRQARLLTLPDASPDSGLPSATMEGPEVWHGEIAAGDCLILMSPNVTRRIGLGPIQDAVLQLHPQAAAEEIHRQFASGSLGSVGGDGILFIEATEVASTHSAVPLKPVWPGESRAGAPERSPIPLADQVAGGVTAVQSTARHAQVAADGWLRRGVYGLFDHMPERPMSRGRATPMTVRRERQHRAAVAVIGILAVTTLIGASMWFLSGATHQDTVTQQQTAQQAFAKAQSDMDTVEGNGRDLVSTDRETAYTYLKDAYTELGVARDNGYEPAQLSDSFARVVADLNRYFHVTTINPQVVVSFQTDDLQSLVLGPDGAAYVLDNTTSVSAIYRVGLDTGASVKVVWVNQASQDGRGIVGTPRLITRGGGDVLILDAFNSLWRWHPAAGDKTGQGSILKVSIPDNVQWGVGPKAMGTFVVNANVNYQYNFYIVVPSQNQILRYTPATDGSSYPTDGRTPYLIVPQDVSNVSDMYVDGNVYLVDSGKITCYNLGSAAAGWKTNPPGDELLRPAPNYKLITADILDQHTGIFYAYDNLNRRVVAFKKTDGTIVGQYMAPPTTPWFTNMTGMFVVPGANNAPPTLYWIEGGSLMRAVLGSSSSTGSSPSSSSKPSSSPSRSAPAASGSTKP